MKRIREHLERLQRCNCPSCKPNAEMLEALLRVAEAAKAFVEEWQPVTPELLTLQESISALEQLQEREA